MKKELDVEKLVEGLNALGEFWQKEDPEVDPIINRIDRKLGVIVEQIACEISKAHKEVES